MTPQVVGFLTLNGLVIGSIYALVALGFVLIYKSSDVINLAQGELVVFGGYVALALMVEYRVPIVPAFFLTLVFAAALGLAVERLVLRPLIGEPIISVIMATIGLSSVLKGIVQLIWGTETRVFPRTFPQEPIPVLGLPVQPVYLWSFAICVLAVVAFTLFFKYSTTGIAMRAAADDQQAALSLGISVSRVFALAWAIAAIVAAVGGFLVGNINGINSATAAIGLRVLPVVILGGLDSIPGAIVGGLIIGVLESFSGVVLPQYLGLGGNIKEVFPFIVLVLILMIRPYGLFGKPIIERV